MGDFLTLASLTMKRSGIGFGYEGKKQTKCNISRALQIQDLFLTNAIGRYLSNLFFTNKILSVAICGFLE